MAQSVTGAWRARPPWARRPQPTRPSGLVELIQAGRLVNTAWSLLTQIKMTSAQQRVSYADARELVVAAVEAGATLEELEQEVFERLALGGDARDALWLLAWEAIERRQQHRRWRR